MSKRKVASMTFNGNYEVIFNNDKSVLNPYSIRLTEYTYKHGEWKKTRKTLEKYADFKSCMIYLTELVPAAKVCHTQIEM